MNIALLLFLVVFFTSCDHLHLKDSQPSPSKQSLVNEVTNKTFLQLKMKKELYPFGVGSGMMNEIKMLALSFRYYNEVEIEQARDLVMAAGTLFLNTINNNEQIRPYLQTYPFKAENIEICIFLQKPDGDEPELKKLSVASMVNGILKYDIRSPETQRLTTIYEEKFEEALEKLSTAISL